MAIDKGELFAQQDVYIDYPFEEVMYRWDHEAKRIYVKFYGKAESSSPISYDNRLFNDALLSGRQVSREIYEAGK